MDPKGKTALVTGAAYGIGHAICLELLQQGIKGIAVCDINVAAGEKAVQEMQREFGQDKAVFIKLDVTNYEEFKEAFQKTLKIFGTLDIVINNAGITNDSLWQREVAINVNGIIHGILLSLETMGKDKGGKGGVVVNTSSIWGLGSGSPLMPIYNGTKQAIVGLTLSFGSEFLWNMTGVRVAAICPSYTSTKQTEHMLAGSCVTLREEWMDKFLKNLDDDEPQKAENVGKGVLQIIREARNGSLWVCEYSKPIYEVKMPTYDTMKV